MTGQDDDPLGIKDASSLTDADWAEINKIRRAYETGGTKALSKACKDLATDPIRYIRVMGAFFPDMIRELLKDTLAEKGVTEDDLRELVEKFDPTPTKQ